MMQIIEPHRIVSKEVESWNQIKEDVDSIREMMLAKKYIGLWKDAFAIHHSQVSEEPYNFFLLDERRADMFGTDVIINPKITETLRANRVVCREACMSYPMSNTRKIKRYTSVGVSYHVRSLLRFKTKEGMIGGLIGEIFQHEVDHANAIYIYD